MSVDKSKINAAMEHPNILGAGAKKREHLNKPEKVATVMKEFAKGTLHSGSGEIVTNPKQAAAIGYSEAKKAKKDSDTHTSANKRISDKVSMHEIRHGKIPFSHS